MSRPASNHHTLSESATHTRTYRRTDTIPPSGYTGASSGGYILRPAPFSDAPRHTRPPPGAQPAPDATPAQRVSGSDLPSRTSHFHGSIALSGNTTRDTRHFTPVLNAHAIVPPLRPFTVFTSPSATFAWPPLVPASQMARSPLLYVDYNGSRAPSSEEPSSEKVNEYGDSRNSAGQRARLQSAISYDSQPSNSFRYVQQYSQSPSDPRPSPDRDSPYADSNSATNHPVEMSPRYTETVDHNHSCRSPSQISETSDTSSHEQPTSHPVVDPLAIALCKQWEQYAKRAETTTGRNLYVCLWKIKRGRREVVCNYSSKKQLVKRHIQTTHLKLKPYICTVCEKGFPQKTYLDIHMSGHTGIAPHKCRFGCGKAFKDPARRHRHYVDIHGYVPKKYKKKYRAPILLLEEFDDEE